MGDHRDSSHRILKTTFAEVAALLERDIPVDERARFQADLDAVAPYVGERTSPLIARIQLALLFLAQADLAELVAAREMADLDRRDLLLSAEYSGDREAIYAWRKGLD